MKHKTKKTLTEYAIDALEEGYGDDIQAADLHHKIFNEDYFIIGYYNAEKWLQKHGISPFEAIKTITEYEENNVGEPITDLSSSEAVVNMYAYIKGEEILNDCQTITDKWDEKLTEKDIKAIVKELKANL